jgi:hypothetical protein
VLKGKQLKLFFKVIDDVSFLSFSFCSIDLLLLTYMDNANKALMDIGL